MTRQRSDLLQGTLDLLVLKTLAPAPLHGYGIARRIEDNHKVPFSYDEAVVKLIASRCTELESGGRMIDAILTNTMLPDISREFLTRMMQGRPITRVAVTVAGAEFAYAFD